MFWRGVTVLNYQTAKELEEDGYRYLGVLEGASMMAMEMKEIVRKEYLRRVKQVTESKLYARSLISSINS